METIELTKDEAVVLLDCINAAASAGMIRSIDAMPAVVSAKKKLESLDSVKQELKEAKKNSNG